MFCYGYYWLEPWCRAGSPACHGTSLSWGDSSLYTKKANGKKGLITSDLEQRLGGPISVAYYPGGEASGRS